MSLSDANVTSLTRSLLQEATAKFWTDAEITLYIQTAMNVVQSDFYHFLYETNKTFTTQTKTSGTATFTVPTDTFKIGGVEVASTGMRLHYISDDEYYKYAEWDAGESICWMFKAGDIMIIPTPTATDTNYWRIWYLPIMDVTTEFPDCLRPLIAVEAAMLGRTKDDNVSPELVLLQRRFHDAAVKALTLTQMQEATLIGDYDLESTYV